MSRIIIFGATGSLGSHVLRLALASGHEVTVFVRSASKLPFECQTRVAVHQGDLSVLAPVEIAKLVNGHDALVNCAGHIAEGQTFVDLIDRLVAAAESLPNSSRLICWFLAGAALLDIGHSHRKGVELPGVRSTYWPHQVNYERIRESELDWRLLCPGPMVEKPAIGLNRMRISLDTLPVQLPAFVGALPGLLLLPFFVNQIPQMIVPYADAAALMLANLKAGDSMSCHRVGLALPPGMRGKKPQWTTKPNSST